MDTNVAHLTVGDRILAWYETNRQQAMLGALIVVLLGVGVGYFIWHTSEKDIASGQALTAVSLSYTGPGGNFRSGATEQLLKVANDYPNSKAGARALLLAAGNFFVDGKYDDARKQFERFTREYKDSPFMGQALLGVAAALDAEGKSNEALTAYKNLTEHHPGDPAVPQAKFSLGRVYVAQGKPEQAKTLFEDVARAEQGTSLAQEAMLQLEGLRQKFPNLFVAPPSMVQPIIGGTNKAAAPIVTPSSNPPAVQLEQPK